MCFDKRVLIGLGVAAVVVLLAAPGVAGAVLPVLLVAACPLSMLVMMRGMHGGQRGAGTTPPGDARDAEVARLRAEVAELKGSQPQPQPLPDRVGADH